LSADPTSLDYGVRRRSDTLHYDRDVTITAVGQEFGLSCSIIGPAGSEFSLQTACPTTLQDTSKELTVRFAPTSVGARSATLRVSSPQGDLYISLAATVPVLWVSPTDHSFGDTFVDTDDGPDSFSVSADHDEAVVVTGISEAAQPGCTHFSNSAIADPTLSAGEGTTFTITHHPTTTGFASCAYTVSNDSAEGTSTTISVTGTGVAPEITLDPASPYDFGQLSPPNPSAQAFIVGNSGTTDLDVTAITKDWTVDCDHFVLSGVGDVTSFPIPHGASESFTVTFAPLGWGIFSCDITIESNDPGESSLFLTVQGECQGECWVIFADGFESGDTSAWSALAPRCGDLTELQCINSGECTFILLGEMTGDYVCRPAEGPCEPGFRQRSDTAESCEAKEGCSLIPGVCYCPPDLVCFCGGGPPPQCMES